MASNSDTLSRRFVNVLQLVHIAWHASSMKAFGKEVKEQNKRDRGHNVDIRRIVRLSWAKSNVLSLSIKEGQWRRKRTGEARMKLAIYKMSEETG